ncbi:MAG: hypothetical protein KIT72_03295 [Polyangiaceae bacterium]|nr:hypothetical protein [Polyangiaceae bacterium]MCW5789426.1 hypothetical protein [Polyangiaceae bacterium]
MQFPSISETFLTGAPREVGRASYSVRYEDITQVGRLRLEAVPQGVGLSAWRDLVARTPLMQLVTRQGLAAIPSRFFIEVTGGPLSIRDPLESVSRYALGRVASADGKTVRLLMNFHTDVYGVVGRTYPPRPPNRGERIHVGRIFSEQVWTRLFAPPGERRVLELPPEHGVAELPLEDYAWREPSAASALPEGANLLDAAPVPDSVLQHFGLVHTDANQHVNSLVYPRLVEEAGLRALARRGLDFARLGVKLELAFARPCFAGQTYRFRAQVFEQPSEAGVRLGVLVSLHPAASSSERIEEKAHLHARLWFDE